MTESFSDQRVVLVRWPAESELRQRLSDAGQLRLLVLEYGVDPPSNVDLQEDWVRPPVTRDDLRVRMANLQARRHLERTPDIDLNGILRYESKSIVLSPTETLLLSSLVRSFGSVVHRQKLLDELSCSSDGRNALDLHIMRLRRRIEPLGLAIRTAWSRGYVLEPHHTDDADESPEATG
ncbi:DNA-binding winged helix-turn-helix (wHTH) protein [Kibdelosporangium banguiense]|uniref:DNA-binding winged helix-turn-helix (WHTH) protein n=1 Tax=Kibdelosporangium banguiense TaxID=1365924 RepID=A0ABS4TYB4_9PSEU|nr:helix-turn-helix domain-containing protein [Kibdelosporangium banguiense]MBP2329395.1 DNA-binding winged helix-turn-helix (wHTH) protein [Kibdelosporangium banguiense]